jgi:hypothetical protein
MNYFLSIVLKCTTGEYIYRLSKGRDIHSCSKVCDISRAGALRWFKENNRRLVHAGMRRNPFYEPGEPMVLLVSRVFQFFGT